MTPTSNDIMWLLINGHAETRDWARSELLKGGFTQEVVDDLEAHRDELKELGR
jgi:hypothetical protein